MKNIFFFFLIVNLFSGIYPIDAQTLISKGSVWKYLDDGSDQGTAWKEVDFNDAAWESGPAILGYGSISAGSISTSLSYGGNSSSKYATTYFRTSFDYSPVGDETSLIFNALADDGAIIYINGTEVLRINMLGGTVSYDTYAAGVGNESAYQKFTVPIEGIELLATNVIAVELHQSSASSSDIGWDLELLTGTDPISNITGIRFGSYGNPLDGLSIAWSSRGDADSIAWGYTNELEYGKFETLKSNSITGTRFEYIFPLLSAGSSLHYSLFDSRDGKWNETRTYNTASDPSDNKYSFTVFGDSRTHMDEWKTISEAAWETDFTLFMGDIINNGKIASDWNAWLEYGESFVSREVVYHCVGNHDDDDSPGGFDNFLGLFTMPGNELYYSFTYGNSVFICLNSEDPDDNEQNNWLLSTLEANKDQTWKVVFFHRPFYTSPNHAGEMDAYFNTWWKAFDDYGVDIIFNGHTHNYQRTKPINRKVSTRSHVESYGSGEGQGRCQIVAGNAGAPLHDAASTNLWWLDNSVSKRHFCNIEIDGDKLKMTAMDADHVVFDELILSKSSADITFNVDLSEVTDLYDGGSVWLDIVPPDTSFIMTDTDGDNIYTLTLTADIGTDLRYSFSYQTGADPINDKNEEVVPPECGDSLSHRILKVPYGNVILPPFLFGSCDVGGSSTLHEIETGFSSKVYPNPTKGLLNIDNLSSNDFSFDIYSIGGKLVLSKHNITGATITVDISGLKKGTYIVDIRYGDQSIKHRVILQ